MLDLNVAIPLHSKKAERSYDSAKMSEWEGEDGDGSVCERMSE